MDLGGIRFDGNFHESQLGSVKVGGSFHGRRLTSVKEIDANFHGSRLNYKTLWKSESTSALPFVLDIRHIWKRCDKYFLRIAPRNFSFHKRQFLKAATLLQTSKRGFKPTSAITRAIKVDDWCLATAVMMVRGDI